MRVSSSGLEQVQVLWGKSEFGGDGREEGFSHDTPVQGGEEGGNDAQGAGVVPGRGVRRGFI